MRATCPAGLRRSASRRRCASSSAPTATSPRSAPSRSPPTRGPARTARRNAKLKLISGLLDVGFDELRQREQQRRNRRMAAITALALVVMAVTIALAISAVIARNGAEVARQAAERRQKQAEHLVGFMLGDLNDKLAQVQRLDIMEAVDDQAMQYFQSLPTTDVTDEALAQRAKALEKIGSVRMDQGHLPAAMQAYQVVAEVRRGACRRPRRRNGAAAGAMRATWAFIGTNHWYQGQLDDALDEFRVGASDPACGREAHRPSDSQLQFELATSKTTSAMCWSRADASTKPRSSIGSMLALSRKSGRRRARQRANGWRNWARPTTTWARWRCCAATSRRPSPNTPPMTRSKPALTARDPKDNNQRENMRGRAAILGRTLALAGEIETGIARSAPGGRRSPRS